MNHVKRNEIRRPYPAHIGDWRCAPAPRIEPIRKPLNFWHVLGALIMSAVTIAAVLGCIMSLLRGLGVFHAHG